MTHDEKIAVIIAARDGRDIEVRQTQAGRIRQEIFDFSGQQSRLIESGALAKDNFRPERLEDWFTAQGEILFDFVAYEYRVKPEPPKPREFWITRCDAGGAHGWKAFTFRPEKECPHCEIIHVREVIE